MMKPVLSGIDDLTLCVDLRKYELRYPNITHTWYYRRKGYVVKRTDLHPDVIYYKVYNIYPKGIHKGIWKTHESDIAPITFYHSPYTHLAYIRIRKVTERYRYRKALEHAVNQVIICKDLDELTIVRCDFFTDVLMNKEKRDQIPLVNRRFKRTHEFAYPDWRRYGKQSGSIRYYNKERENQKSRNEYYVDPKLIPKNQATYRIEVVCKGRRLRNIFKTERNIYFKDLLRLYPDHPEAAKTPFYMIFQLKFKKGKLRSNAKYKRQFYSFRRKATIEGVEKAYDFASKRRVVKTWFEKIELGETLRHLLCGGLSELLDRTYDIEIKKSIKKYARTGRGKKCPPVTPMTNLFNCSKIEPTQTELDRLAINSGFY